MSGIYLILAEFQTKLQGLPLFFLFRFWPNLDKIVRLTPCDFIRLRPNFDHPCDFSRFGPNLDKAARLTPCDFISFGTNLDIVPQFRCTKSAIIITVFLYIFYILFQFQHYKYRPVPLINIHVRITTGNTYSNL